MLYKVGSALRLDSSLGLGRMADTDQNASLAPDNGGQDSGAQENGVQIAVPVNGDESGAPASFSETVWIFGETLPASQISPIDTVGAHQLGDGGDLALAAMVAVEAPMQFGPRARSTDDGD